MPAPSLPATISLDTTREEIVSSVALLGAHPTGKPHVPKMKAMLTAWTKTRDAQHDCWDAITIADAAIVGADDGLDEFIAEFAQVVETAAGKKSATWALYFKQAPSELLRPVLGEELKEMKRWQKALAKEKSKPVAAMKKRLEGLVAAADAATKARDDARSENESFRKTGGLATFMKLLTKTRDEVANAVDAAVTKDDTLPRGLSARFFRHRVARPTGAAAAEKKAKAEAAKKAKAEKAAVIAAAKTRMKAAQAELRAAMKKG